MLWFGVQMGPSWRLVLVKLDRGIMVSRSGLSPSSPVLMALIYEYQESPNRDYPETPCDSIIPVAEARVGTGGLVLWLCPCETETHLN